RDLGPTALGLSAPCQEACSPSPTKPGQRWPAGTGNVLEDMQADGAYTEGRDTRHTLSCSLAFGPAITSTKANAKGNSKSREDEAKLQPASPLHPLNYPQHTHTYIHACPAPQGQAPKRQQASLHSSTHSLTQTDCRRTDC
ncbi:hypothetical protein ABG768_005629, partial [Culter alburnus]